MIDRVLAKMFRIYWVRIDYISGWGRSGRVRRVIFLYIWIDGVYNVFGAGGFIGCN